MKCGYAKCKRQFTSIGFYHQRYCSAVCRSRAINARRQARYRKNEAYRKKCQERARAYYRWQLHVIPT